MLWSIYILIKMTKKFTCLTLSREPMNRSVPDDCDYYNQIQTFRHSSEFNDARIRSVENVTTPYFFVCDSDDPMPNELIIPDKAILYGDIHINENGIDRSHKASDWSHEANIRNPQLMHKPICNTEVAKKIIPYLPRGDFNTDVTLYYCLALLGGYTYNPSLIIKWNKNKTGEHTKRRSAMINSLNWLIANKSRLELLRI